MPNNDWVHRTTRQHLTRHSPASMEARFGEPFKNVDGEPFHVDWIFNPDLAAVEGRPTKYWIITSDLITLMTVAEQAVVDTATQATRRDQIVTQLDQVEDLLRAFMQVVLDEVNVLRFEHGLAPRTLAQLRKVVRDKLGS